MCAPFRRTWHRHPDPADEAWAGTPCHCQIAAIPFSCVLLFRDADWMMSMHVRFRQNDFHFAHRDHRQEANEEEEEGEENSVGANKGPDVDPGRNEQAP